MKKLTPFVFLLCLLTSHADIIIKCDDGLQLLMLDSSIVLDSNICNHYWEKFSYSDTVTVIDSSKIKLDTSQLADNSSEQQIKRTDYSFLYKITFEIVIVFVFLLVLV